MEAIFQVCETVEFDCNGDNLFVLELEGKIAVKLNLPVSRIGRILIKSNSLNQLTEQIDSNQLNQQTRQNLEISSDRDVYLLKDMDSLCIEVLEEGKEKKPPAVVHLPRISYQEYVAMHPVPPWAGYYVIGKSTEEEEMQVIKALFAAHENQDTI